MFVISGLIGGKQYACCDDKSPTFATKVPLGSAITVDCTFRKPIRVLRAESRQPMLRVRQRSVLCSKLANGSIIALKPIGKSSLVSSQNDTSWQFGRIASFPMVFE